MARETNGRMKIPIATVVVLIVIVVGLIGQWFLFGEDIEDNKTKLVDMDEHHSKELADIDEDGCEPAQENKTNIAVINNKIDTVQGDVKELGSEMKSMQTVQTTRHIELLEAIQKK